jgi:hypothetical protein
MQGDLPHRWENCLVTCSPPHRCPSEHPSRKDLGVTEAASNSPSYSYILMLALAPGLAPSVSTHCLPEAPSSPRFYF